MIVPNAQCADNRVDDIEGIWLGAFRQRTRSTNADVGIDISRVRMSSFCVYALIHDLPVQTDKS
ncbi:MAG: hypothetical protein GWP03_04880 [Proteobacteria bacterium]|nr:hypothetical protein [Pseudomonadota bacterium]